MKPRIILMAILLLFTITACAKKAEIPAHLAGKMTSEAGTRAPNDGALKDTPLHVHSFGAWTETQAADCKKEGKRERVCACGAREIESIPLAAHTASDWLLDFPGNCEEVGRYRKICTVCTATLDLQTTDYGDHVYEDGVCKICQLPKYSTGLQYTVNYDQITCTVKGIGSCRDTEVWIPAKIDGYSVTQIASAAFQGNTSITAVTLPEGVRSIGNEAFRNCTALVSVSLPESLQTLGTDVFAGCTALAMTEHDGVLYLGNSNNSYLVALKANDTAALEIRVAEGCVTVADAAFQNCKGLTSAILSEGVKHLGAQVFYGCAMLKTLTVPDSLCDVGTNCFDACDSLEYSCSNSVYYLGNADNPYVIAADTVNVYITEAKLENGCRILYHELFSGCRSLGGEVEIPQTVCYIGERAFSNCQAVTKIVIPEGVTGINFRTFEACTSLCGLVLPSTLTSIEEGAFADCHSLRTVVIPEGVVAIGVNAFGGCCGLTVVTLPKSLVWIRYNAFAGVPIVTLYYGGTKEAWEALTATLETGNTALTSALQYVFGFNAQPEETEVDQHG